LSGRPIEVNLPDGRILHGTTDPTGKYHFELPTEGFAEEQALQITARLPQDNVAARARGMLAIRGFETGLSTSRDVYLDGESFQLQVVTTDAQGEPVGQTLTAAVVKQVVTHGQVTEREAQRKPLETDSKTGRASPSFRIDDSQGGRYIVRVAGTDRFGNPIVADRVLTISGKQDETKLRLLADRHKYKVGEEARANLHSRDRAGPALLTWEADRVLTYKIVILKEGDNTVAWAVDGAQFPNFTLTATRMWQDQFDQARLDIEVERELRVTVAPARPVVGPGDPVELEVTMLDQRGRPVSAELSIAMIDQSLLRLYSDTLPAIGPFFYNQTRTGAFATEATNTFRYAPATVAVSQAVVDEAERMAAVAGNEAERGRILEQVRQLGRSEPETATRNAALAPGLVPAAAPGDNGMRSRSGEAMGRWAGRAYGKRIDIVDKVAATDGRSKKMGDDIPVARDWSTRLPGAPFAFEPQKAGQMQPRGRFAETAYWNPQVVTGKDGKARISFKAPTALSAYRIAARGITGADTLAGQTTASLTVRKSFFVDLKVPSSLTQGDKPRFVARVHHTNVVGKLALRLSIYAGGRDLVFPRTLDLKQDGVDEVLFEPFDVPEGDSVRLALSGSTADLRDELAVEVPVRHWGVRVVASESGTSSESGTIFVGLPAGRTYESPEMVFVLSPTLKRMLIELALGDEASPALNVLSANAPKPTWPPCNTIADRASDLLAGTAALEYLRRERATAAPEAQRLAHRIGGLVSSLIAAQNQDGGWPWVSGSPLPRAGGKVPLATSERLASAAVVWALASAEPLGLVSDGKVLDKAVAYLNQEFAKTSGSDHETRAALLHALSTRRAAGFEAANSLNRARKELSDPALAYLALTFANLDQASLAGELIGILAPRAKTEATDPGRPARVYWNNVRRSQAIRGAAETTALVSLAYSRVRPEAPELDGAVAWLLAHRAGTGWQPYKARGPALAALTAYYRQAQGAEDRYRLTLKVNDTQVAELNVDGTTAGQVIAVPKKALKIGQPNRVRFDMEGRGRYGYAVTLAGFTRELKPDQDRTNRTALIERRVYHPAAPELEGKVLPVGQYRSLPTSIKSAYEPGRFHLGPASELHVRAAGEPSTDPYKPTPDELYARGMAHFDAGRLILAGEALEPLSAAYTLRDLVAKNAARMLLLINIRREQPRKIVQYFEVVKEKAPELVLGFDQLLAIGKAYRDINEIERAMIVWRGQIEASYLEDARVGELLRQRGKPLESIAYLIELWRSYPNTASIESDFFGLSQLLAQTASQALTNPGLRRELAAAGITRSELLLQSIRMIQVFLSQSPASPVADEASLALLGAFTELEDYRAADRLAARFAKLYPRSAYLDSFQYSEALANFHLGQYDRAIEVARTIAGATYKDAAGALEPSPNKWQALYILGQIHDARRQPGKALEYYRQVADRFTDAASAIESYTRKELKVPEVSVVRPSNRPVLAAQLPATEPDSRGFRVVDVVGGAGRAVEPANRPGIGVDYRNIGQVDVKVYPVDLMQLYLTRRNLNGIAAIDLAGVTPLVEKTVALGDGADYDEKSKSIDLPLAKEGAYLTMIRGDNLYASGIVLVTPLEMEVLEEPIRPGPGVMTGDRVRIMVRDASTKEFLPKVQVKVIGSDTPQFISGETDLRGVFAAEGLRGLVTAVARKGTAQYAFYRGSTYVGPPLAQGSGSGGRAANRKPAAQGQALDANLKHQNASNSRRQIERLQQRYAPPADNSKGAAAGGFR